MSDPFNGLTPAEAERLAMLAEECAEVIQIVGKILRHGYESHHPDHPNVSNRELLGGELIDVAAVAGAMRGEGEVGTPVASDIGRAWVTKLRYAHHQGEQG